MLKIFLVFNIGKFVVENFRSFGWGVLEIEKNLKCIFGFFVVFFLNGFYVIINVVMFIVCKLDV